MLLKQLSNMKKYCEGGEGMLKEKSQLRGEVISGGRELQKKNFFKGKGGGSLERWDG